MWEVLLSPSRWGYCLGDGGWTCQEDRDHQIATGLSIMFLGMIFLAPWPGIPLPPSERAFAWCRWLHSIRSASWRG